MTDPVVAQIVKNHYGDDESPPPNAMTAYATLAKLPEPEGTVMLFDDSEAGGCEEALYWLDAQVIAHARRIALLAFEAAARECDRLESGKHADGTPAAGVAWECAEAIRALSARLTEGKAHGPKA